jgi:hypothetical protein
MSAHGWQEVTDPGSGKIYFYNSKTNATQWDRPAELAIAGGPDADPINWVSLACCALSWLMRLCTQTAATAPTGQT